MKSLFQTIAVLGAVLVALASQAFSQKRTFAYTPEMLDLLRSIPIQDGGRIKPLETFADFTLLAINNKRSLKVEGLAPEKTLSSEAFLADLLFFPEQAKDYPCFVIADKGTAVAIGLELENKRKRDRYTFNELNSVRNELDGRAMEAMRRDSKNRSTLDRQILNLWRNVRLVEDISSELAFVGHPLPTATIPALAQVFQGQDVELPQFLAKAPQVGQIATQGGGGPEFAELQSELMHLIERNMMGLGLFPPGIDGLDRETWTSWSEWLDPALMGDSVTLAKIPMLESLAQVARAGQDPEAFTARLKDFHSKVVAIAKARGEYDKVDKEISFYKWDYFFNSLYLFVFGFLFVAVAWLLSEGSKAQKICLGGAWVATAGGLALLITGITMRCILRHRPPVSTLYETILFIAAVGVLVGLFVEWANRQRIALAVSAVMGAIGMFMAARYELQEAVTSGDTMPSLVAVLDTNFWLATHVTTINMGYAAGLLASILAHVYLFSALFGKGRRDPKVLSNLYRMVYGVLAFSLLFSVVGTILGGVWANDSWGRFWGWDPKENGALMICLAELALVHARLGGYLKGFGMAVGTVLLGIVIAFSWWGVNLLNIGLHSYGFTEGVFGWLLLFIFSELAIVVLAGVIRVVQSAGDSSNLQGT
ncbi:MAG: cytochrome c biogenesis protein CcsA [Planctomycetota bacterium]